MGTRVKYLPVILTLAVSSYIPSFTVTSILITGGIPFSWKCSKSCSKSSL